jgi:hypothetical protein
MRNKRNPQSSALRTALSLSGICVLLVITSIFWNRDAAKTSIQATSLAYNSASGGLKNDLESVQSQPNISKDDANPSEGELGALQAGQIQGQQTAYKAADSSISMTASHLQSGFPIDRHATWKPSAERDKESSNPDLAAVLRKIAINDEVAVAISNRNLAADNYMLASWWGYHHGAR